MKYIVVLCDGMADYPLKEFDNKTPMAVANKPNMDYLASHGEVGLVKTVADGLNPGSDVANLSVLGYDPALYYSGRSPLEAASIGIDLSDTDVTFRCNLVTLSNEEDYEHKTILDYCAGDISTKEAKLLIDSLDRELGNDMMKFYTGVSYRHCLVLKNATLDLSRFTPPHDILNKKITEYLPDPVKSGFLLDLMEDSFDLLSKHEVNVERVKKGLLPANSIWLWGEGKKKPLKPFEDKYGIKGSMISAVDLLKGIGKLAKMNVVEVDDVTGYIDTNFKGKAYAAINELLKGQDFVYVHLEAPDECGHRAEVKNKIRSIEYIDERVIGPIIESMKSNGEDFKIMVLPDHATPLSLRTHTTDLVPFLIYDSTSEKQSGIDCFDELSAKSTDKVVGEGHKLMDKFILK
ncbi:MAG: cofactor-independent phosphoglycerate mutase [Oscillospiraceae bacterium]|nr:cofactor-independent phosphoglycerate mutase [Oscillospiraceae bacterium]